MYCKYMQREQQIEQLAVMGVLSAQCEATTYFHLFRISFFFCEMEWNSQLLYALFCLVLNGTHQSQNGYHCGSEMVYSSWEHQHSEMLQVISFA